MVDAKGSIDDVDVKAKISGNGRQCGSLGTLSILMSGYKCLMVQEQVIAIFGIQISRCYEHPWSFSLKLQGRLSAHGRLCLLLHASRMVPRHGTVGLREPPCRKSFGKSVGLITLHH